MTAMRVMIGGSAFTLLTGAAVLARTSAGPQAQERTNQCTVRAYGQALGVDERALSQRNSDLQGRSAEGGTMTVFHQRGTPRLLRISDYGETGSAVTSIFLVDSTSFVVWRTEYRYAASLAANAQPRVADSTIAIEFFCDRTPLGDANVDSADAMNLVRAAFRGPAGESR